MQLAPLPADRFDAWRSAARDRIAVRSDRSRLRIGADAEEHADRFLTELLPEGAATPTSLILVVGHDGRERGTVWLGAAGDKVFIVDLDLDDGVSATALGELYDQIVRIARDREASRLSIALHPDDRIGHALIAGRGFTLASIQMILEPLPARELDPRIEVSAMSAERYRSFAAHSEAEFALDLAASGRYTEEEAVAESHRQMLAELPDGVDTPGQSLLTASVDGEEVGILWVGARLRDGSPHAFVLDIEVAKEHRRQGYGRELMHAAEREARAIGADSIGLHVFGFNTGAVDLYEQLGYRRAEESFFLDL
ncbi:MAG: GNAT family N-acetyltransferase [Microbacterium sp.]|nr:GNAT family N-acetyltransferase [Microbacterium sp.]